ncbi:MAG TPA: class I SAM-dependent methyltransferase [Vicinamibacterales bacterium]|nr:class I SAM-dependent methyltransferase [Vicinamibacterales bacterium]
MALSDLFSRRRKEPPDFDAGDAPAHPTKVLERFVGSLAARDQPVLLDLGPVVGSNVSFFGEQLGCKIFVEDITKDIDRHVREGKLDALADALSSRFPQESDSIDGILCWDVFDYLDRKPARSLAVQLARVLKPDGVLLAFFSTTQPQPGMRPEYTRHVVVSPTALEFRPCPAARGRQRPLPNRDIQLLFEPLRVADQFLLLTNRREVLLRKKPATPDAEIPSTDTEVSSIDSEVPSIDSEVSSIDTEVSSTETEVSSTDTEPPSTER